MSLLYFMQPCNYPTIRNVSRFCPLFLPLFCLGFILKTFIIAIIHPHVPESLIALTSTIQTILWKYRVTHEAPWSFVFLIGINLKRWISIWRVASTRLWTHKSRTKSALLLSISTAAAHIVKSVRNTAPAQPCVTSMVVRRPLSLRKW